LLIAIRADSLVPLSVVPLSKFFAILLSQMNTHAQFLHIDDFTREVHYSLDVAEPKQHKNSEKYVVAAMDFVDKHGIAALTMRALGEQMGVDPTAVYRHFPNKESLIDAMLSALLGSALSQLSNGNRTPREEIMNTIMTVRSEFERHPNLTPSFVTSMGNIPNGLLLTQEMIRQLRALGITGENLVRCYQMLEGYIMGASVFDTGGAPQTFEIRQSRYRFLNDPDFDNAARTTAEVERITKEGFTAGVNFLLDYCESLREN
jgi:TetR/AcrR family tetracycline transcriptional repressor